MDTSELIIADICAGAGMLGEGVRIALETVGARARSGLYLEWEACAAASLVSRMEDQSLYPAPVWCGDIQSFDGKLWHGAVDILTAGYPCQPFSSAGRRRGESDPRHIWPEIRRLVEEIQPGIVFLENVDGHVSLGLRSVLRDIRRIGYEVTAGVFSAEEVGAPHLRKRVFILGLADFEAERHQSENFASKPEVCRKGRRHKAEPVSCAGGELGDGTGSREKSHAERSGSRRTTGKPGGLVGDSGSNEFGESRSRPRQCDGEEVSRGLCELGRTSDQLGDSEHVRPRRGGEPGEATGERRGGLSDAGEDVVDGFSEGAEVRRPIFPPARTDYRRWAGLSAGGLDPTLMPSIERGVPVVADGLAPSADLLRLGGNGVVPAQAAWAFLNLYCCLLGEVEATERQLDLFSGL